MDCKHLLDHRASPFHSGKVSDGLSGMIASPDAFLSDLTPEELLDYRCNRLHTFLYEEGQLNYIFPSIKEFNQQYYSIAIDYKR